MTRSPRGDLAACGDVGVTSNTYPQHVQFVQSLVPSLLRGRSAEEDVGDDDPGAGTGHCGDSLGPGRFQRPERWPQGHFVGQLDAGVRCQ